MGYGATQIIGGLCATAFPPELVLGNAIFFTASLHMVLPYQIQQASHILLHLLLKKITF